MAKEKVVKFELNKNLIKKLAFKRVDNGDYVGALDFLLPLVKGETAPEIMLDIADIYRDMDEFDLSNRYIFKYMSKVKPKDLSSVYEDLAVNHFYLDRYDIASYYLKKKLDKDGFLDRDSLDPEILEYYSSGDENEIRLVYPPNLANYEKEYKKAVREMASGNFQDAIDIFLQIPKECKDFLNAVDKIAYAYFLIEDYDNSLLYTKEMVKLKGESVLTYCHLANIYEKKNNQEKSNYYYLKAKECEIKETEELARLVVCALEKKDALFASTLIEKLLKEKEYSGDLLIYYGQTLINTNRWQKAREVFSKAYRINNKNYIAKYYLKFTDRLLNDDKNAKSMLPIPFNADLPESEYEKLIGKLMVLNAQEKKAFSESLKKKEIQEMFLFGVESRNENISEACIFTLLKSKSPFSKNLLNECLLLDSVDVSVKRAIVYTLAFNGQNQLSLTINGRYNRVKIGEVLATKEQESVVYFAGYISAISLLSITSFEDYNKLTLKANAVYTALKDSGEDFTMDEIGGLIVYLLEYGKLNSKKVICQYFGLKKERFNQILELYKKGNLND